MTRGSMTDGRRLFERRTALAFGVSAVIAAVVAGKFPVLLLWTVAGWTLGIVVHELGHAAFAAMASIAAYRIVIGVGPLLWRARLRDTWLEVRVWPVAGHVQSYLSVNDRGYREALFLIGGVMGNLAVVGLLFALHRLGAQADAVRALMIPQMAIILLSTVPSPSRHGGSDGLKLLHLLRRPATGAAALRAACDAWISARSRTRSQ